MTRRGTPRRACLAFLLLLAACARPPADPVEGTLRAIAEAARKRDADAVLAHLTPGFTGSSGLSREETGAELRRYFVLYESIEVGIADLAIDRTRPGAAVARFRVSVAGKPKNIGAFAGMLPEAERFQFEATLLERDGWRISAATWERLSASP